MNTIRITRLGRDGDGVAEDGAFIPFTLPGEDIRPGPPPEILTPSPSRITPVCPHFSRCGGCSLQHASDAFLADWKSQVVRRALAARDLEAPFRPIHVSPPGARRRATFAGRRTRKTVQLGFHERRSDVIVDLETCPVLSPRILDLRPALLEIVGQLASRRGTVSLSVTVTDGGSDVAVGADKPLTLELRNTLASLARAHGLGRLTVGGELICTLDQPLILMGKAQVHPPPGAFLQATQDGEKALVTAVLDAVTGADRCLDLFSGCGTFSLPLARTAKVHAVEGDAAMAAALDAAWRTTPDLHPLSVERRDLFRRPLSPAELAGWTAAVIDPPRAGAEAQCNALAASDVQVIAHVSCNPVTFARDARTLVDGGYTLDWVQVVDQFRWSGHVELAARFSR